MPEIFKMFIYYIKTTNNSQISISQPNPDSLKTGQL